MYILYILIQHGFFKWVKRRFIVRENIRKYNKVKPWQRKILTCALKEVQYWEQDILKEMTLVKAWGKNENCVAGEQRHLTGAERCYLGQGDNMLVKLEGIVDERRFQIAHREIGVDPEVPEVSWARHILKVVFYKDVFLKSGVHSEGRRWVTCLGSCLDVAVICQQVGEWE